MTDQLKYQAKPSKASAKSTVKVGATAVLAAALLMPVAQAESQPEPPAWEYDAYYNPVAGSRTFYAGVEGADSAMELRCSARNPNTELRLRVPHGRQDTTVAVAFDKRKPQTLDWVPSVNGQSFRLSTQQITNFSRGLSAFNTLTVQVPQPDAEPKTFQISLRGSAKAISNLRRHCRFI